MRFNWFLDWQTLTRTPPRQGPLRSEAEPPTPTQGEGDMSDFPDLVQRLRDLSNPRSGRITSIEEAADEIERLRSALGDDHAVRIRADIWKAAAAALQK